MRAVAQRVNSARVEVDGQVTGAIREGLLVYLGAAQDDDARDVEMMVRKLAGLRIFRNASDEDDRMTSSVQDLQGAVLVVSQFTLFGDVRRGRRPSFDGAAPPDRARELYEAVVSGIRELGIETQTGQFRAMMHVIADVEGPVTILIDTKKVF